MKEKLDENFIKSLVNIALGIVRGKSDPYELVNGAVEYLISNGADINSLCKNIHVIAQNGHLNIIKFFAEKKLDFHYENDKPLRIAAEYGQLDVVKYLVSIGLDINKESSYCIKKASENGHIDVVEFLIQKGANI